MNNIAPAGWVNGVSPDYSWRKFTFYNYNYVPYEVFDGCVFPENYYSAYLAAYNERKAVPSPLTVTELDKWLTGTQAYVKVRVTLAEAVAAGKKVYIFLWEDKVAAGSHTWRFLERAMSTQDLTVTAAGQTQDFEYTFAVNPSWKAGDLGVAVFVQEPSGTHNVMNAYATEYPSTAVTPASLGRVKAAFF